MHEFSLAMDVLDLVADEARKHQVSAIREVEILVGDLSGVDLPAFETALDLARKGTLLETACLDLVRVLGKGFCSECGQEFSMDDRLSACPACGRLPSEIRGGTEFRVVSMVAD